MIDLDAMDAQNTGMKINGLHWRALLAQQKQQRRQQQQLLLRRLKTKVAARCFNLFER